MKLCVFQGTFNPVHNAHLRVAEYINQIYNFDKFLFIPACNPPHKACDLKYSQHRLKMVNLAVKNMSGVEVSDIEYQREGKSYTYLTICELYKKYEVEDKIHFVIGTDAFKHIESWYETDKLKNLVKFIVFIREDNYEASSLHHLKEKGYNFEVQNLPYKDISSTDLRLKIKNGEDISQYLPKNVEEYIEKNGLYKD